MPLNSKELFMKRIFQIGSIILTGFLLAGCAAEIKPADRDLAAHLIVTRSGGQVHPDWYECDVFTDDRPCHWKTNDEVYNLYTEALKERESLEGNERTIIQNQIDEYQTFGSIKALSKHIITSFGEQHAETGITELLLFLNGGLNSSAVSVERARQQYRWILDNGAGAYPVFLAWPTPLLESYWDNIARVRDSVQYTKRQDSWPLYLAGDALETVARSPVAYAASANRFKQTVWHDESLLEMRADRPLLALAENESGLPQDCRNTIADNSKAKKYEITESKNLIYDHRRCKIDDETVQVADIERSFEREDLGYLAWTPVRLLSIPLVDTLGRTAWEQMLRRNQTMIRRDVEFNPFLRVEYGSHAVAESTGFDFCVDDDTGKPYSDPEDTVRTPETKEERDKITACRIKKHKTEFPAGTGAIARFIQVLNICWMAAKDDSFPGEPLERKSKDLVCDVVQHVKGDDQIALRKKQKTREALTKMQITLIGHSMGAIAGNEILKAIPDLPWVNIVYMAAASSIKETNEAVSPVLIKNGGQTKFYNLMLHPLNDAREISFVNEETYGFFKGIVPAGSLLAWIDTYFQQPKTIQDRTMGRWDNLRAARDVFPSEARQWMAWRVFNLDPRPDVEGNAFEYADHEAEGRCAFESITFDASKPLRHPMKHGDFNCLDQRWWTKRFWTGETELGGTVVTFKGDQETTH